jgi:hypothetical protein
LHRQADPQVAAVAIVNSKSPADDVVQHLVAATERAWVHDGSVVLQVDPGGDLHRRREQLRQQAAVRVVVGVVVVQENAPAEVGAARAVAGREHQCSISGEAPLGSHLRPVAGAVAHGRQQRDRIARLCRQAECGRSFGARSLAGLREPA